MNARQPSIQVLGSGAGRMIKPMIAFIAFLWFVEITDRLLFGSSLDQLGIVPREYIGLRGVLFAPFLHGSFSHLAANTVPLVILGVLVMLRNRERFVAIAAVIALISGIGTWLIGPAHTVHIGASGLVFGFFAYLLVSAWYERSLAAVFLAVLIVFLYGSMLVGILPAANAISWQGHIFGLIGGGLAAYWYSPRG